MCARTLEQGCDTSGIALALHVGSLSSITSTVWPVSTIIFTEIIKLKHKVRWKNSEDNQANKEVGRRKSRSM